MKRIKLFVLCSVLRKLDAFLKIGIPQFAADKVQSGNWPQEGAVERSRQESAQLLPQGLATPHHHFFAVIQASPHERLGWLWLMVEKQEAFIYEIIIDEPYRRQGYGRKTMQLAEREAKRLGATKMGLHVFGFNHTARALYEKLGYAITNINMSKTLDP